MKKMLLILVLLGAAVLTVACVAQPAVTPISALGQGLVGLPDDAKTLVLSLAAAGLAFVLTKINLGQYTQFLAAVIAPIIITAIENALGTIPPVFDNLVLALLHLIVLFVSGSIGALLFFKRFGQPKQLLT